MRMSLLCLIGLLGAAAVVGQTPPPPPAGTAGYAACADTKTVCVPECYLRTKTKTVYTSRTEPMCLSYFRGLFPLCRCKLCGCDTSGYCGPPYVRRYLVKKVSTCQEYAIRCVPQEVPACASRGCAHPSGSPVGAKR